MPNVILENVSVRYKQRRKRYISATEDVSFTFPSDQITCIIGDSGCGKTSILRAIIGLVDFTGDVLYEDVSIKKFDARDRHISYVSQSIGLYPHMSIYNNIAFPLKVTGCQENEIRDRVGEVADLLHIRSILGRKPREISLGQAQRVAIARALVKKSMVYLFDEPFSNLDKPLSFELTAELKAIFTRNKNTVIFVSHSIEETFLLADNIVVMSDGKIIESGTPHQILESRNETTKELLEEFKKNHGEEK